jgi:Fic family protein
MKKCDINKPSHPFTPMPFNPRYSITNLILKHIGAIDACREVIINAPIIPAWEKQFVQEAVIRTVHYGTAIEGNALSFDQAQRVLEGRQVLARDRDIQEVLNYREVLKYIDRLGDRIGVEGSRDTALIYTRQMILRIYALTVEKILEPLHQEEAFRNSEVIIRSVIPGQPSYKAPPAVEVPILIESFLLWINGNQARQIHPVLRAGIAHYLLTAIHPFIEGNGRVARAMAMLILWAEKYDIRKLFSIEEYFDRDVQGYYMALQQVSNQSPEIEKRDLTPWLEYFTQALAIELTKVREKVRRLSMDVKLKNKMGKQLALSERQIKLVEFMKDHQELFMRDAQDLIPKVSDDTILRDLKNLMDKGLVKKQGRTKAARYILIS